MCGIAGIISFEQRNAGESRAKLEGLLNQIIHRGPDDSGVFVNDRIAIGMRRLSIIDIAGGKQPIISECNKFILVFNGEIYNFRELRAELQMQGYSFNTQSDSEVILKGYQCWGREVVTRLNGMFAFVIYDDVKSEVFIARDHFGIKPLYLSKTENSLSFCSEPQVFNSSTNSLRKLDRTGVIQFLMHKYVPFERTLINGLSKFPVGSYMVVDLKTNSFETHKYWGVEHCEPEYVEDPREKIKELLVTAVKRQFVSDVPVGLFLSGGIDSSLLLWACKEAGVDNFAGAFSVGFNSKSYDETPVAKRVADYFGVDFRSEILPEPTGDEVDGYIRRFGEPFANTSIPANFLLHDFACQHVKVALNGSGADEIFGGYDRYFAVQPPAVFSLIGALSPLLSFIINHAKTGPKKNSIISKAKRYLELLRKPEGERHSASVRLFLQDELSNLLGGDVMVDDIIANHYAQSPCSSSLTKASWVDINTMMPDDYLTLVDRTSMSASVEVRLPYLDLDLAGFGFSLPVNLKIKGFKKKVLLRSVAQEVLPDDIWKLPKAGFESPVGEWFRGGLGEKFVTACMNSPVGGLFNEQYLQSILRDHQQGRCDSSKQLLGLYTLSRWSDINQLSLG